MGSTALPTRDLKLAGLTMMAVAALCTVGGLGVGYLLGSAAAGGFIGALIGVPVALLVLWRVYLKPFGEASAQRDYSHLSPKLGDDD